MKTPELEHHFERKMTNKMKRSISATARGFLLVATRVAAAMADAVGGAFSDLRSQVIAMEEASSLALLAGPIAAFMIRHFRKTSAAARNSG